MRLRSSKFQSLMPFAAGLALAWGTALFLNDGSSWHSTTLAQAVRPEQTKALSSEGLIQDVAILKDKIPDQSHAMTDVDYHFCNLWFAARANNWPLANFYWQETLSHLKWAVRVIPVRKDNAGQEIQLHDILQSIENSPFMQIGKTIESNDVQEFEKAYRFTVEGCYDCHKAVGKPYLRPHIPERPASNMINFDPNPDWPK